MAAKLSGYITLGEHKLHYIRMGSGKRILLAFHGYHNTADIFLPFASYLEREFTIISIDLPHHGRSVWSDIKYLEVSDINLLIDAVLKENEVAEISLLGYSMGGRVCLKIVELAPQVVDNVLLIAPDGLALNIFYFFVTRTHLGTRLFRNFLNTPQKYLTFIEWAKKRKWIDESRYRFAMHYISSDSSRSFLLKVWPAMSRIVPNQAALRQAIQKHKIPVHIFMGNYDRIIPPSLGKKFKKGLESVHLHLLEKGHRVLDYETMPQMAKCLLS